MTTPTNAIERLCLAMLEADGIKFADPAMQEIGASRYRHYAKAALATLEASRPVDDAVVEALRELIEWLEDHQRDFECDVDKLVEPARAALAKQGTG